MAAPPGRGLQPAGTESLADRRQAGRYPAQSERSRGLSRPGAGRISGKILRSPKSFLSKAGGDLGRGDPGFRDPPLPQELQSYRILLVEMERNGLWRDVGIWGPGNPNCMQTIEICRPSDRFGTISLSQLRIGIGDVGIRLGASFDARMQSQTSGRGVGGGKVCPDVFVNNADLSN